MKTLLSILGLLARKTRIASLLVGGLAAGLLAGGAAHARMEKIGDLENGVAVSSDANFLNQAGQGLLRTWILLDFQEEQRFDRGASPLNPAPALGYRSRKDYVQVDCRHNLYSELATQMFPDQEGKGKVVFESSYHRSPMPRFATPASHEGVVLQFLCRGVRPN